MIEIRQTIGPAGFGDYALTLTVENLNLAEAHLLGVSTAMLVDDLNHAANAKAAADAAAEVDDINRPVLVKLNIATNEAFDSKVQAIKVLREASTPMLGLKIAKDAVEQVMEGRYFTFTSTPARLDVSSLHMFFEFETC